MKSFALDAQGDVLIENGDIVMVHGAELTQQTVKSVLGTQKGEWFLDWDEGINHNNILGKTVVEDEIVRAELLDGLTQVDENFIIEDFESNFDKAERKLTVNFTAANSETTESVTINDVWG